MSFQQLLGNKLVEAFGLLHEKRSLLLFKRDVIFFLVIELIKFFNFCHFFGLKITVSKMVKCENIRLRDQSIVEFELWN